MSINAIKVNEIFEGKIKLYKIAPLSLIMEKANYIKSNRIQKFGKSDKIKWQKFISAKENKSEIIS